MLIAARWTLLNGGQQNASRRLVLGFVRGQPGVAQRERAPFVAVGVGVNRGRALKGHDGLGQTKTETTRWVGPQALDAAAHAQSVMQPVNGAFQLIGHHGSTLSGLGVNHHAIGNARSVVGHRERHRFVLVDGNVKVNGVGPPVRGVVNGLLDAVKQVHAPVADGLQHVAGVYDGNALVRLVAHSSTSCSAMARSRTGNMAWSLAEMSCRTSSQIATLLGSMAQSMCSA